MVLIDDEVLKAAHITESELKTELAILFYQQGRLSLGRCAALAGLSKLDFEHLLFERKVPRYTDEQWQADLKALAEMSPKNAGRQ